MQQLDCSVDSCVYNKRECCCRGEICVDGREAKSSEDTCCRSFEEKRGDSFLSATEHPTQTINVECKATDCIYNKGCICDARHIGIAGSNACHCEQTECASFCCH